MKRIIGIIAAVTVALSLSAIPASAGEFCQEPEPGCEGVITDVARAPSGAPVLVTFTNDNAVAAQFSITYQRLGKFANERTILSGEIAGQSTAAFTVSVPSFRRGRDAGLIFGHLECEAGAGSVDVYRTIVLS